MDGLLSSTSSNLIFFTVTYETHEHDTFRGKQAALIINLLGKGLTQEINGDGGSIWWAPAADSSKPSLTRTKINFP